MYTCFRIFESFPHHRFRLNSGSRFQFRPEPEPEFCLQFRPEIPVNRNSGRGLMTMNQLHINMTKCCYIIFKPKSRVIDQPYPNFQLKINDTIIKAVTHTKFLGVTIDENLDWGHHITDLKRKLYHSLSTLSKLKSSVPEDILRDLYYTLFESHLVYSISAWGGLAEHKISHIHKIQKKCSGSCLGTLKPT